MLTSKKKKSVDKIIGFLVRDGLELDDNRCHKKVDHNIDNCRIATEVEIRGWYIHYKSNTIEKNELQEWDANWQSQMEVGGINKKEKFGSNHLMDDYIFFSFGEWWKSLGCCIFWWYANIFVARKVSASESCTYFSDKYRRVGSELTRKLDSHQERFLW